MALPTLIYGSKHVPRFPLLPVGENPGNEGDMIAQVNEIPPQQRGRNIPIILLCLDKKSTYLIRNSKWGPTKL